ncbi:MAG TPA: tripartite tricarboxylate transporter substrate binding protein [Acetobacteraceae bacterium]|nr:tripartite tricarboxylate transporter substrate binding protein [Acetobacteraceae bacterium]
MITTRRAALAAAATLTSVNAHAQAAWPAARPIRLVVGFPPGGSGDFLARTFAEPLGRELAQSIVVENRPGAGSNIASEHVARSEPDGYTILLGGNFSHAVNPAMYRRVPFDPVADFTPITRLTDLPTLICVRPQSGITSLGELVTRARAEPGRWTYATPGNGTPSHLAGAMMARVAGLEWTHVPFRGGAPSLQAVLAGDVNVLIGTPPVALPQVRGGNLRALSVTTRAPSPVIPDAPGAEQAGLPGLDIAGWWGLWAPARLPPAIRDRYFEVFTRILAQPTVQDRMKQEGLQPIPSTSPAEFDSFIRQQIPFWAEVVRAAGAVAE